MADFYYDDRRLIGLFSDLEPKRRRQALRGAFSQAARELRQEALRNLRSSGLRSNRDLEKGVRQIVWRRHLGFRVTIGTRNKRIDYSGMTATERKNRAHRERLAIVPLWAEGGTSERRTSRSGRLGGFILKAAGKGRRTGRMPAFRFMERTKAGFTSAEERLKEKIVSNIEKTAMKYGGILR